MKTQIKQVYTNLQFHNPDLVEGHQRKTGREAGHEREQCSSELALAAGHRAEKQLTVKSTCTRSPVFSSLRWNLRPVKEVQPTVAR